VRASINESIGFCGVAGLAALYLASFQPLSRPTMFDPATWEYMSLAMLDGRVPYRDVFLHKTPGAMFLGAFGAKIAGLAGLPPLVGVRSTFIALGALAPALLYLLCLRRGAPSILSFAAAIWLLTFEQWSLAAIEGVRPKVATTTLGLACLLFANTRPALSGAMGAASTLCWQPGLLYLATALACSMNPKRSGRPGHGARRRAAVRLVAGAALPVAALLLYLVYEGALVSFLDQSVIFNAHYIESKARTPIDTVRRLWTLTRKWNPVHLALLPVALVGLYRSTRGLPRDVVGATLLYLGLAFVSLQAWPDTILLGPGIAALLAVGLVRLMAGDDKRTSAPGVIVGFVGLALLLQPKSARFDPPITLDQQRDFMAALSTSLQPDDSVYVVSCPEFLVLTGRHSVLPWPYMWFGVDRFAVERTVGGFEGILNELERYDPELMLVCRRWHGGLRQRFEAWAAARYSRHQVAYYPHTKRPMAVYRRDRTNVRAKSN
jgi:hypothetical protein